MSPTLRIGVIGATGRGGYGHSIHTSFVGLDGVEYVALADADAEGRHRAMKQLGVSNGYADYHDMLNAKKPDVVCICPRRCDERLEMFLACIDAGVKGILCEKPITGSLSEADRIVAASKANGVRIAVALRRASFYEQYAKQLVEQGAIGDVVTMRGHGKGDARAGAQDFAILGIHILDSMRFFAGSDVSWAHGHVSQEGKDVEQSDAYEGDEGIGLIAGNRLAAYYVFRNGITAHYESYQGGNRSGSRCFGFEIYGTEGIISLLDSPGGEMYIYPYCFQIPGDVTGKWDRVLLDEWERWPDGRIRNPAERRDYSNQMVANELVKSILEDREVASAASGEDARAALEMVTAAHLSHRLGTRVSFPLIYRGNPYDGLGIEDCQPRGALVQ